MYSDLEKIQITAISVHSLQANRVQKLDKVEVHRVNSKPAQSKWHWRDAEGAELHWQGADGEELSEPALPPNTELPQNCPF